MSDIILKAENISKQYRLGVVGLGTLAHDFNRFWHKIQGKEDPYLKVGSVNDRSAKASSDYVWALQDINFEVKRGEVLGIIGKNGAGKSTLLKILSRVTAPSTGSIKTGGRIASLLEVGTGMHPELTGRENIYLNGAILGMTKTEISSKIDEIIDFSGCEMYIDTPVKRYSSGMRVRLGFAVAAFLEPDILVVDEVLAVGDAEFQKKAIGKMKDISTTSGRTVLFVSHDMTSIKNLCTRAIILSNGTVTFNGSVDEAVDNYLSDEDLEFDINDSAYLERVVVKKNDSIVNNINIGDDFCIELKFKNNLEISEALNYCVIGFHNSLGQRVLTTGTHLDKDFNGEFIDNSILKCNFKQIELNEGEYSLLIAIGTKLPRKNIEVNENVLSLKIINNNYFNNGEKLRANQGVYVCKAKWNLA